MVDVEPGAYLEGDDVADRRRHRKDVAPIFLGRFLGLYLVAISGGMLANRRRTLATLDEMARSGPWMLFSGMVATAGGLAVVLGHQVWSGGALPVAIARRRWPS
jgi:hypothetical protein